MANTIPTGSQPISGKVAGTTGSVSTTLGSSSNIGRTCTLTGFSIWTSNATAATSCNVTASYAPQGNQAAIVLGSWTYPVQTSGFTQTPMVVNLIPPMAAMCPIDGTSNSSTVTSTGTLTVSATAPGTGATYIGLNAWGYMQ